MNFQSVIALLHQFWGERGCLIAQPYDIDISNVVMQVVHLNNR
ncbi:glycine--tRNA ligase subunit alpha [Nostoc sp. UCD121]|nr:glycine--tRNA ligase subunit alpha [Nostoc sp. UCD121]